MKLEVGKTYRLNNGEEHVCERGEAGGFIMGNYWYNANGRCGGFTAQDPISVACEVTDDQYKPLSEFAPFKTGERFRDHMGDVLTICDNCEKYVWTYLGGENHSGEKHPILLGDCSLAFTPLDRDDDTPKLWRDMTDAEKGALLLAEHEGKEIPGLDAFAYRVRPKFCPTCGHKYQPDV